jgi:hypothetical protein
MARKVYVEVTAKFDVDGNIRPIEIVWEDGRRYGITKITDTRPAASLKVGGVGVRYTCLIDRRETFLFMDGTKWFVEAKSYT